MTLRSWTRNLFAPATTAPVVHRPRLALQSLEAREVPATFTVTNLLGDANPGSLRWAVGQANATAGADTITFAAGLGGTVSLGGSELSLTDTSGPTTISGPGADRIAVSGNFASRVLSVGAGATATVTGLTIQDGVANYGGGVFNSGNLTLTQCEVTGNQAVGADEFVRGGGVYNRGSLTLNRTTVAENTTTGGPLLGAPTPMTLLQDAQARGIDLTAPVGGGGVFNDRGTLAVHQSTVANNTTTGSADFMSLAVGGGVLSFQGSVAVRQSTVAGNYADVVGTDGVYVDGVTPSFANSIVLGGVGSPSGYAAFNNQGGNVISQGMSGVATDADGRAALAYHGGSTRTVALVANSPALDAGLPANATDAQGQALATDQRGQVRSMNGRVDAGAFELQMVTTPDGARWYLGATGPGRDRYIYRQPVGGAPAAVDGWANRIGQTADGAVVVQNAAGQVFARPGSQSGTGAGWAQLSTATTGDGATWILGPDTRGNGDRRLYRWAAGVALAATDGWGNRIGTAADGSVLHTNGYGGVYARPGSQTGTGSNWVQLAAATAGDGAIWFLGPDSRWNGDRRIYRWGTNGVLTATDGWAVSIWTATDGSILHRNGFGEVYGRPGSNAGLGSGWVRL
jgi:hypothetical protein